MCVSFSKGPLRWTPRFALGTGMLFLLGIRGSVGDIDAMEVKLAPTKALRWSLLEFSKNVANVPSLDCFAQYVCECHDTCHMV